MTCCVTAGPVENVWREIVGVTRDIRQANLDEPPAATMYRPYTQIFEHDMFLMVRTRTDRDMPACCRRACRASCGRSTRRWSGGRFGRCIR